MPGRRSRPGAGVRFQVSGAGRTGFRCQVVSQGSGSGRQKRGCLRVLCGNATTRPNPLPRMCQAGRKACQLSRRAADKKSVIAGKAKKNSSKLNDRSLYVYENKGLLCKTPAVSRNVYENKGSWPLKARMLLKRKEVNWRGQVVARCGQCFGSRILPPPLHRHGQLAPWTERTHLR